MKNDDQYSTRRTLITRVQNQHDESSWEDFIKTYDPFIYSVIRKMDISSHDADDLTQQVLITLWKKMPETNLDKIPRFRSWLATITKNCVIDFIRKKKADALRLEKATQTEDLTYLKSIRLPEIETIVETQWKVHLTNLAMKNIRPLFTGHAMDVFDLVLQGVDRDEIARRLDIQPRSVYRLKSRVMARLTEEIEHLRTDLEL